MREKGVIYLLILPVHDQKLLVNIVNKGNYFMEGLLKSMLDIVLNRLVHVGINPFDRLQALVFNILLF